MALSEQEIRSIRAQFPIFERKVYLNSCSQGALSHRVREAIKEYMESWEKDGSPWEKWVEKYESLRITFARFIGADAEEIAVVSSASEAVNALASSMDFGTRTDVVFGELEFPTMSYVWQAQKKRGAVVRILESEAGRVAPEAYRCAIDKRTLLVPCTHVSFTSGARTDIAAVVEAAHKSGALVLVDDYQDAGTRAFDVRASDIEFYVTGALKYLLGVPGIAFLYVRGDLAKSLTPTTSGWFAQENPFSFDVRNFAPADGAARFQNGTPPIPNAYAALAGLQMLTEIGTDNIREHVKKLASYFMRQARALGVVVRTPEDSIGPLVVLEALDLDRVIAELGDRGIVVSGRHDGLRVSFHVYNTVEDVDVLIAALKEYKTLLRCV